MSRRPALSLALVCLAFLFSPLPRQADASPKGVKDATKAMASKDVATRIEAVRTLAQAGPAAKAAIPQLVDALDDEYWDVRKGAAAALGAIGEDAIPALVPLLEENSYWRSRYAAEAIGLMGRQGAPAAEALSRTLAHKDWEVRMWAGWAASQLGPDAAPALDALTEIVERQDGLDMVYATRAIAAIGPDAVSAVPALEQAMSRGNGEALGALIAVGDEGVNAIGRMLTAADKNQAWMAIEGLKRAGPAAAPFVPQLIQHVKQPRDQWFCANAAEALGAIGPEAGDAANTLVDVMTGHSYADARRKAAAALGRIGRRTPAVRDALREATKDKDAGVAAAAKESLKQLQADEVKS